MPGKRACPHDKPSSEGGGKGIKMNSFFIKFIILFVCSSQFVFCVTKDEFRKLEGEWLGGHTLVVRYDPKEEMSHNNYDGNQFVSHSVRYLILNKLPAPNTYIFKEYASPYETTTDPFRPENKQEFYPGREMLTCYEESLGTFISVDGGRIIYVWCKEESGFARVSFDTRYPNRILPKYWVDLNSLEGKYEVRVWHFRVLNEDKDNNRLLLSWLSFADDNNRIYTVYSYRLATTKAFNPSESNVDLASGMSNIYSLGLSGMKELYCPDEFSIEPCRYFKRYLNGAPVNPKELCDVLYSYIEFLRRFCGSWQYEEYGEKGEIVDSGFAQGLYHSSSTEVFFMSRKKSDSATIVSKSFAISKADKFFMRGKLVHVLSKEGNRVVYKGYDYIGEGATTNLSDILKHSSEIYLQGKNKSYKLEFSENNAVIKIFYKEEGDWILELKMRKLIENPTEK